MNRLSLASFTAILLSASFSMLAFNDLRYLCVCISNWMAWSWISFGISIILGLLPNLLYFLRPFSNSRLHFIELIQILFFLAGTAMLVYFAGLLVRVW